MQIALSADGGADAISVDKQTDSAPLWGADATSVDKQT